MSENDSPTDEEMAKFYIEQSISLIGHMDTMDAMVGNSTSVPRTAGAESSQTMLENLSLSFSEGVRKVMQNKRELGHSPVSAWGMAVEDDWPQWVKESLAESEYTTFGGRSHDPKYLTEEEEEYIAFLEGEFNVPK